MKVISLLQPWATMLVMGAKRIETRSWNTKFRGDILIHASQKMDYQQKNLCYESPFADFLELYDELPLGKIIGKARIVDTIPSEDLFIAGNTSVQVGSDVWKLNKQEYQLGDYSPRRYGWLLTDAVEFTNKLPVKGQLSIWDFPKQICLGCGCTDEDCRHCIEKTGYPCHWVSENLCSACKNQNS